MRCDVAGPSHLSTTVRLSARVALLALAVSALVAGAPGPLAAQGCGATDRPLELVNNCTQTLWLGAAGNAAATVCTANADCQVNQYCSPIVGRSTTKCSSNADCPAKNSCSGGVCTFRQCTYVPLGGTSTTGSTRCSANSDCTASQFCSTSTDTCATVPSGGNGWQVAAGDPPVSLCAPSTWGGRFWARTGCADSGGQLLCQTGQCLGSDGTSFALSCAQSGVPPMTAAELFLPVFDGTAKDFYDVSMVDGFNLPVQIEPTAGTFKGDDLYECTIPGATAATLPSGSQLDACGWDLDATSCPAGLRLVFIQPGVAPTTCTGDADCTTAGEICGVTPRSPASFACGPYVACASAQDACSFFPTMAAPLDCQTQVAGQGTRDQLYGCKGVNADSCYGVTQATCCGCPSWTAKYHGTEGCKGTNPSWTQLAEPFAAALKDACPSAYSFAFDDPTSTFTCLAQAATDNVGYTVTFCPPGSPGAAAAPVPAPAGDDSGKTSGAR